jgi:hypothetical protein
LLDWEQAARKRAAARSASFMVAIVMYFAMKSQ